MNDVNEEIDGVGIIGSQWNQIGSSRKVINPSDHGLVLLDCLCAAALIHDAELIWEASLAEVGLVSWAAGAHAGLPEWSPRSHFGAPRANFIDNT